MINYVIYGKIIIDDIRLLDGGIVRGVIGGGGPQAAFGARLWDASVGFLTRSGTDIEPGPEQALKDLGIDLAGWVQYPDLATPHGLMAYDEDEYMDLTESFEERKRAFKRKMGELLSRAVPIPTHYRAPRVVHLITEFTDEPMVHEALEMKEEGAIYSLEPLIDYHNWSNRAKMLNHLEHVDVVTPDWPSASGIAGSDDPFTVLRFWSKLGPDLVAVRHGGQGSYVWDRFNDEMWHIPVLDVKAVDPTGCGNAYGGGLCVAWDRHRDARLAGCCGTVSASYMVTNVGVPPVTTNLETEARRKLEALINRVRPLGG
jgi:sugar/nucleoside kinase (ribokinase family)